MSTASDTEAAERLSKQPPELVFGIVSAMGTDKAPLREYLEDALKLVGYQLIPIKLMDWVTSCEKWCSVATGRSYGQSADARITAGNEFCVDYGSADAFAMIAIARIFEEREARSPHARLAFAVESLKRPEEVVRLRELYGPNFILLGAYESKRQRTINLTRKIRASVHCTQDQEFAGDAERLMSRDEREYAQHFGQNVQKTFECSDVFLDASDRKRLRETVDRFVQALYGHPCCTPTLHEYAMCQAFVASLRSSAARQVGACIVDAHGEVLALGANEVPKAFGGQQWASDVDSMARQDLEHGPDSNDEMINGILADLFRRLTHHRWLNEELLPGLYDDAGGARTVGARLVQLALRKKILQPVASEVDDSLGQRALIEQVIEYVRAVHAEMGAIMSAVRRGVPVRGATLYTTTFPCHECARHIVAAGISRVIFIEPYPKSRAEYLYYDAVSVDGRNIEGRVPFEAYVGIAPRAYARIFAAPTRETGGIRLAWETMKRDETSPRGVLPRQAYLERERIYARIFFAMATRKRLGSEANLGALARCLVPEERVSGEALTESSAPPQQSRPSTLPPSGSSAHP